MENSCETEKHAEASRVLAFLAEERYRVQMMACIALGLLTGCGSSLVYGNGDGWSGTVTVYCQNGFLWTLLEILPVTVGFVAILYAIAPFLGTRWLIGPAVCVRTMGMGALICGVIQADDLRGLCFAALTLFPYTVVNVLLMVKAGEFALGLRDSLRQENNGFKSSVVRHTLGRLLAYLLVAALSCAVFGLSCAGFGTYLL